MALPVACFLRKVWVLASTTWSSSVVPTSRIPWSYLPDLLAPWMMALRVSEKYLNKRFCFWTCIPRIRLRNLLISL